MDQTLAQACSGFLLDQTKADAAHQLDHVQRVVKLAVSLAKQEQANLAVVEPAAWLHDCVSLDKSHPQRHMAAQWAADKAVDFLKQIGYEPRLFSAIHHAISAHSYSGNVVATTLEAKVVQDADRLDALGAIGITRCIQVGSQLGRPFYHSQDPFCQRRAADDQAYSLDHFYTKLLLIGDSLHTEAAKREAKRRSDFMRSYLAQLGSELEPMND
ncbi:HD domain-containing protein [Agarivorans gilvus]|uniref:Phosphohydrolase n=1 Tax=Agarivorans gilvus TaxID=680279 RepID=A0ABQ1HY31_9ALTE|nr:HD domain-containing protein [Agarivorans gilvus]GGA98277.1 phosphohydrolase [Agarivorans gilvus]